MGQNFYCPRCNTYIIYGTPKCSGCGATFGFTEQISRDNAKKHTGVLSQPDILQIQYLIKNEKPEEAVNLCQGL
ncbi:MAG: hypothetical protein IJA32_05855 [Lachnospiraceae bacterium]|nr:hypothetical protein [Lachnospiraceae bacterium]